MGNGVNTGIDITVGTEETLIIIQDIGNENDDFELIPRNAIATHEYEKKELVYTVQIALREDLEGENLESHLGKEDLEATVNVEDHLAVNVEIEKENNVWTAKITVKLNENIIDSETFDAYTKDKDNKIDIDFTLTPTPAQD